MDHSNESSVCGCGREFNQRKNLYVHLRKIHGIEPLNSKPAPNFHCNTCDKSFIYQSSLNRHVRTFHRGDNDHDYSNPGVVRKIRLICPYEGCSEELKYYENLRQHLLDSHGFEVQCENLTFDSFKDFETWKEEIQQLTFSLYTKDSACKPLKSGVSRMFMNCHRSYCYNKKGYNIRATKSIGTNKIGKACPSRLEVTINEKTKSEAIVSVKYWKTHCGHTQEIERITLKRDIMLKIAEKRPMKKRTRFLE